MLRPPGAHGVRSSAECAGRSCGRRTPRRGRRRRRASRRSEYWNDRPQKNRPGASSTTPRYSRGQPSSPKTGRSIQSNVLPEAGRPDDVGDVDDRAVREQRQPVLDALDPRLVAHHAALGEVRALHAQHRPAVEADVRHLLAADGRTPGDHVPPQEQQHREDDLHPPRLQPAPGSRRSPGRPAWSAGSPPPRRRCRCRSGRRRRPDGPSRELAGAAVLARVQLQDRRVEVASRRRARRRPPEGAGRHDDVVAVQRAGVGVDDEAVTARRVAGRPGRPGRRAGPGGRTVRRSLEVVGDVVLAGERPRLGRERHARQPVVLARGSRAAGCPTAGASRRRSAGCGRGRRTSRPCCFRWYAVDRPACPAPMMTVSTWSMVAPGVPAGAGGRHRRNGGAPVASGWIPICSMVLMGRLAHGGG